MENKYIIPELPLKYDLETKAVLKQLNLSNKKLAELKGVAQTIPNENILKIRSHCKRPKTARKLKT